MAVVAGLVDAAPVDLDAVMSAFVADSTRSTLELPNLTPEQRKQAKKLVERSGLGCESFGFGSERRLHVFKEVSEPATAAAKPPFLPPQILTTRDEEGIGSADTANSLSGQSGHTPRTSMLAHFGAQKPPGLATPVGPLEVKHTFIHFDDEKPVESRQIQSMPPGFFQSALWAEALSMKMAEDAMAAPFVPSPMSSRAPSKSSACGGPVLLGSVAVPPPPSQKAPASPTECQQFSPGTPIEVCGLSRCPAFNGRRGRVGSFDEESGRYNIILCGPSGEEQWAKVKHENLLLVPPPTPLSSQPPALAAPGPLQQVPAAR